MLLVRTRLAQSPIHGLGLFADQDIPAGTPTWRFHQGLDARIPAEATGDLPETVKAQLDRYAYRDTDTGELILCADDARYYNHDDTPNTVSVPDGHGGYHDIAARDIRAGEELTCDYRTFDADWRAKLQPADHTR